MRQEAKVAGQAAAGEPRMGCDPYSVVLPALSALASIASIAAVLWAAQDPVAARSRDRRKPGVAVRDLETDCLMLQEIFRRLQRNLRAAPSAHAVATAPLKFGLFGLDIAPTALMDDLARVLASSARNALEIVHAVESGAIEAPEPLFYRFGECQERLNRLVVERASLKVAIEEGLALAIRLTELVRELKQLAAET